ncbi:MAG: helix-turn-helix domain-containing protein, partial [Nocardioidaceae bacterium]
MPMLLPTLRLREHREALGLTQAELAERLVQMAWARERIHVGVNGDMVSKWERGLKQPSKLYRRLLCLTMDASPHELGLLLNADDPANLSAAGAVVAPGLLPVSAPHFTPGAVNADVLAQVDHLFTSLAAMDTAVGARLALGAATHEATMLEQLSQQIRSRHQRDLQLAAARFAELTGWLHQDLGDLEQARQWSERAMDLAVLNG